MLKLFKCKHPAEYLTPLDVLERESGEYSFTAMTFKCRKCGEKLGWFVKCDGDRTYVGKWELPFPGDGVECGV